MRNQCAECAKKDAVIAALQDALARRSEPSNAYQYDYDPTAHCPCRPENGGSGVCGCTLSGLKVIC